jgi:NADPH:quinone reductase-like Zn-dependent oxidoreductase
VLEELAKLIESGSLAAHVGQVFSLSEAAQAQAASETGHGRGRIVLRMSS